MNEVGSNENKNGSSFEEMLRKQMKALSDNVDCYDEIVSKVFPERSISYSSGGFIDPEEETETVPPKKHISAVIKFGAAAAAVLIAFALVPKHITIESMKRDSGKEAALMSYKELLTDLKKAENDASNYTVFEMSLEDYARNDVLIDPLFRCPFDTENMIDAKVKLFIRKNLYFNTNEAYAVEYTGDYNENNFIAIASSGVKFTEKELSEFDSMYENEAAEAYLKTLFCPEGERLCGIAAEHHFKGAENGGLTDLDGNPVSAAAYSFTTLYKDDDGIKPVSTSVLYYHDNTETKENPDFRFDTFSFYEDKATDAVVEFEPESNFGGWEACVYYDGISAFPDENALEENHEELFTDLNDIPESGELEYIMPYSEYERQAIRDNYSPSEQFKMVTSGNALASRVSTIGDKGARNSMMMFGARGKLYIRNEDDLNYYGVRIVSTRDRDTQSYLEAAVRITPAASLKELREKRMNAKKALVRDVLSYNMNKSHVAYYIDNTNVNTYDITYTMLLTESTLKRRKAYLEQIREQIRSKGGFDAAEKAVEMQENEECRTMYLSELGSIIENQKSNLDYIISEKADLKEQIREWNPDISEEQLQVMYEDGLRCRDEEIKAIKAHIEELEELRDHFDEIIA